MNLIAFVGYGSGKMSGYFYKALAKSKTEHFKIKTFKVFDEFKFYLEKKHKRFNKIFIFPIYCEDKELKRTFKIELALQVESFCKNYNNCTVFHSSHLSEILGDKYKTNLFLTSKGIRCPKIIEDTSYNKEVFVNARSASHAKTTILNNGSNINLKNYNTELIDTTFEYKGEKYYACPRTMCIQGIITDIFLRFRNANENNPNVHGGDTPMDPDLHNFYYETKILPNLDRLNEYCFKVGEAFGLGFYGHDLLLCSKTNEFYMAESSFKFDNIIMWKNVLKDILPFIKHEKSIEASTNNAINTLLTLLQKNYI